MNSTLTSGLLTGRPFGAVLFLRHKQVNKCLASNISYIDSDGDVRYVAISLNINSMVIIIFPYTLRVYQVKKILKLI